MSTLRDHLEAIYESRGRLTPQDVVEVARDPAHPLHNRFDWNDSVAAEKWREDQARNLIRSVKVVYTTSPDDTGRALRAWQSVRYQEPGDTEDAPPRTAYRYEPTDKVIQDPVLSRIVLADMEREWKAMYRRYKEYEAFRSMVQNDLNELSPAAA